MLKVLVEVISIMVSFLDIFVVNLRSNSSVGGSGSVAGTASQSSDGGMDGTGSRGNCSNRSSTDEGLEEDEEDNDENDLHSSDESVSGRIRIYCYTQYVCTNVSQS